MTRRGSPRATSLPPIVVAVAALAGLALRIWVLAVPLGRVDADESAVGLMARHVWHRELTTFFWGQRYGGAQEAFAAALLFALTGSSVVALKIVPIVLHAVAAWLAWRVGKRTVGDRAARVGALAFWIFPAVFVWWSTKEGCFYGATLVLGLSALLVALRLVERPTHADSFVLGLVLGAGIWASPQILYYAVPVALWLVACRGAWLIRAGSRALPYAWRAIAGLVVGAAPFIRFNVTHDWSSLHYSSGNTYGENLRLFFDKALPVGLGLQHPYSGKWALPMFGHLAVPVVIGVFLASFLLRRTELLPLQLVVLLYPFLFAKTPQFGLTPLEPRYLYYLAPPVLLLAGLLLQRFATAALAVLLVASIIGLASFNSWARHSPTHADIDSIAPRDVTPMVLALERAHVRYAFAPYRYAYRFPFESRERIIVTPLDVFLVRYTPFDREVRSSGDPAYVFLAGGDGERDFETWARAAHEEARVLHAGDFVAFIPATKTLPEQIAGVQSFGGH